MATPARPHGDEVGPASARPGRPSGGTGRPAPPRVADVTRLGLGLGVADMVGHTLTAPSPGLGRPATAVDAVPAVTARRQAVAAEAVG